MNSSSNEKSDTDSDADSGTAPRRNVKRLLMHATIIVAVVLLLTVGLHFWQERVVGQASAALESGDAKYAHFLLKGFLEKHPGHQRAMALQARTLVTLGAADEAIGLFDQVGAADVEDIHAWARALMMKGQWSHALPLLERALALDPEHADALYEAAACQVRLSKFTEALVNAQKLTQNPEQAARGYVFVGTIHGDLANFPEANKAFEEVLKLEPEAENLQVTPAEFFLQQARTLLRLGKPKDALLPLKRSVAAQENPEAFVLLGNAALQLGEQDNAAQAWQRAVQLDPANQEAREALANVALQKGKPEDALKWLQPLASMPELPASTAYLFQRTYTLLKDEDEIKKWQKFTEQRRQHEELRHDLTVLLLESPDSFWARVVRAYQFAERGNWGEAEILLKRCLQEAPAEPFIIELSDAVFRRTELPPIEELPVDRF